MMDDHFGSENPRKMPGHLFGYGITFMDYETAIRANVEEQNYSVCPRHWYVDAKIRCADCGEQFLFSKEEQRHWFEKLRFWVESFPVRCKSCQEARKELHQQLDYIQNHHLSPQKAEEVRAKVDEVVSRYGFMPLPLKEIFESRA